MDDYEKWIDDTWLIQSKRFSPYYIVDGQQRLTTSIVLINSIIEVMNELNINKLNFTSVEEIRRKFIFDSKDENKSRTYIFGYEESNPSYECLITKIYKQKSQHSSVPEETTYTANLENARNLFVDKLKCLDATQLEEVYTKITQHFLFNIYVISSDIDVYVTFETMNNRGKPLSHLELLKNRLIYLSTLFDTDESNQLRLRRNINTCWKDIYHFLGKNKQKQLPDDEFLNAHFQLYFCKQLNDIYKPHPYYRYYGLGGFQAIQQSYLLDKHFVPQNISTNKLNIEDVFDYIENLKCNIELWNSINNPIYSSFNDEIQEYLTKISYLTMGRRNYPIYRQNSSIKVLLLACLENCENEIVILRFLKSLEKHLFIMSLYPYECFAQCHSHIEFDFTEMVIKIKKGEIAINGVADKLDKISTYIKSSIEINNKLIEVYHKTGFYGSDFLKYFLCEYEVALMKQSKSMIAKLDRDILFENGYESIEHIYPQNAHYKYWTDIFKNYNTKEKNSLRNSLGNFVVISSNKNHRLANKPFPEKKCNDQNTIGYKYGTYAEIELTNYENWGANEILDRGIKLLNFLNRRWGIKIGSGNKSDKKDFLGLSFL